MKSSVDRPHALRKPKSRINAGVSESHPLAVTVGSRLVFGEAGPGDFGVGVGLAGADANATTTGSA